MSTTSDAAPLFLQPAGLGHVHDMRRLDAQVYPNPWTAQLWRREVERSDTDACYVVASIGGRHVGHAGLLVQVGDGHIVTVAVDPAEQRQGIATRLMLVLTRRAVRLGLDALTLEVRLGNQPAQDLYRRFGFGPAGVRPRYYADDGEDALIMWAHGVAEPDFVHRLDALAGELVGRAIHHPVVDELLDAPAGIEVRS